MKKFILLALLALSVSSVYSATINVPADQPTIQAGMRINVHAPNGSDAFGFEA